MKVSGQSPFVFAYRDDLLTLPNKAFNCEVDLHCGGRLQTLDLLFSDT